MLVKTDHVFMPEADGGDDLLRCEVAGVRVRGNAVEIPHKAEKLDDKPHRSVHVKQEFTVYITSDTFLCDIYTEHYYSQLQSED